MSPPSSGDLPALLDRLEAADGPADPLPSTDGWELVLAESIGYLVDDRRRWRALEQPRDRVGLEPEQILRAPDSVLREIVVGASPNDRIARLRRCAELAVAGARWRDYPGIGAPGAERIELFTAAKTVLALDANGMRVLTRLGLAQPARSYSASYRQAQSAASARLGHSVPELQRAYQLLRRHGQHKCRRNTPDCASCPIAASCPSAGRAAPLY
jgi:endonuclease III-like uncharacterized protein